MDSYLEIITVHIRTAVKVWRPPDIKLLILQSIDKMFDYKTARDLVLSPGLKNFILVGGRWWNRSWKNVANISIRLLYHSWSILLAYHTFEVSMNTSLLVKKHTVDWPFVKWNTNTWLVTFCANLKTVMSSEVGMKVENLLTDLLRNGSLVGH